MCTSFNRKNNKVYPIRAYPIKCGTHLMTKERYEFLNVKDKDEYELITYKQTYEPACEIIISEKITRI